MNTFRKLTKESLKFYLIAMGLMLFFVISDSVFICRDSEIAFMDSSVEQKIESEIQKIRDNGGSVEIPQYGMDLTDVFRDKASSAQLMGFFVTMIGITLLLLARKFYYTDVRAREFYKVLPIKEGTSALYDYLLVLSVILTGALVQGAILTGALTNYNRTWVTLVAGNSGGSAAQDMIHEANQYTLTYMLCYFLFIVVFYTWIYLGVTVTKNPIVGIFCSVVTWYVLYMILVWYVVVPFLFSWLNKDGAVEKALGMSKWDHISTFIESFLSPVDFFDYLDWESRTMTNSNIPGYSMWLSVGAMVIFTLFLVMLIILAANKRELAKGKLFYFPLLDYPFSFLCGLCFCFSLLDDNWGILALAIGFISAVLLCLLIHPFSNRKSDNWEVK